MYKNLIRNFFTVVLFISFYITQGQTIFRKELNKNWRFRNIDETTWYKAIVPGNIYEDLYRNNLIDNPLFGTNFEACQFVDETNWEYTTYFDFKPSNKSLLAKKEYEIVFEGIHTYAEVILNGQRIFFSDNFNKEWRADITKIVQPENNYLIVRFYDKINFLKLYTENNTKSLSWNATLPAYMNETEFTKSFVGFGIWKNVYITEKKQATKSIEVEPLILLDTSTYTLENDLNNIETRCAVWLPLNVFAGANTNTDYFKMITLCKRANINTLRVWGGGYYEKDIFYELCTANNIAVIQDIVVNKNTYAMNPSELNMYKDAIISNINKIKKHPCIIAWAGNIENEFNSNTDILYQGAYAKFIQDSLPIYINRIDKRPYMVWNYNMDKKLPSYAQNNMWWTINNKTNMNGKLEHIAYQSLPDISTVKQFTKKINDDSYQLQEHQKCEFGFEKINQGLEEYPPARDSVAYIYFTQLLQRDKLIASINRQRGAYPLKKGISIWHFNDSWPGITCSIVDYYQKPKAAYYALKTMYSDNFVALSKTLYNESEKNILDTNKYAYAFVINNPTIDIGNLITNLYVLNFYGDTIYKLPNIHWQNGILNQYYNTEVFSRNIASSFDWSSQYIKLEIVDNLNELKHTQRFYLGTPKEFKLDKSHIFFNWVDDHTLEIQANSFSKDIYLYSNSSKTVFSDNYFDLEKYETKTIHVENFNAKKDILKIFSFYDMCAD